MFSVLDRDGDGLLRRADYVRRVENLALLCGWELDSPEYRRNLQFASEEWRSLCESADVDEDGVVTREEFRQYAEMFLGDRDAVRAYARGDVQVLFDSMDTDGDGKVSAAEYRTYLQTCEIDPAFADLFFAHSDLNEDGWISRAEMAHAVEEFWLSEDPDAGGNFLFGPLLPAQRLR